MAKYDKTLFEHIDASDKLGAGPLLATHDALGFTAGNVPKYGSGGKLTDSGTAPGGGGGGGAGFLDYIPIVEPTLGDWTLVDGTSGSAATTSSANGGMVLMAPNQSGSNWALLKKAAPSAPFYVEFGLMGLGLYGFGILLREASSGKFASTRWELNNVNGIIRLDNWNSETSFNGVVVGNTACGVFGPVVYLRYVDDNTNRFSLVSANGRDWTKFAAAAVGRTSFATMDEVGFGLVPQTTAFGSAGSHDCHVTCFHYDEGTP